MAAATADLIADFFLHHDVNGTATTPQHKQHTTINHYFEIESTYLSDHTAEQICQRQHLSYTSAERKMPPKHAHAGCHH
eukprot:8646710-Ditylum_brightwellii.AAC.1